MYDVRSRDIGKAYREQEVLTAPPERIIGYLYQGLERFLLQAKAGVEAGESVRVGEIAGKAQGIVWELLGALDMEKGGKLAEDLAALYRFMIDRIVKGGLEKRSEPFDEALRVLEPLKEGWNELLVKRGGTGASPAV